ncbi:hypothetical protein SY89_01032 [Halolamina pelagica]|uniref:DUF424 domain-containing protein n=1 Tax=Halolamina pelagica TaxID=699431 RepID=A0A0P7GXU9_9EURY|nr:DUF424 family protein [Halolamina pelagica]KPN30305.1 hypothetical protein SY89_01032 [Halolamina pelagica]
MLLRERETERGLLVSVCDADLVGQTFENGQVSITVSESFYAGESAVDADADAVIDGLRRASVANLVGEECVGVAVEAGIIDEGAVLEIGETRHAQLLQIQ